ncbi:MAG: hypothetical protein ACO3RX_01590 [Chthoniobacterales bacterium]
MNSLHTVAPAWLPPDIEGETVTAWRLLTVPVPNMSRVAPCGYQIITVGGIYESTMDGTIVRATHLNMVTGSAQ